MPGAINIPLPEIRDAVNNGHGKEYFTVRRRAAFILVQKGYSVAMAATGSMQALHLSETAEDRIRNSGIYN